MSNTSSISGIIKMSNGEILPGVVVSVEGEGIEHNHATVTDSEGHFLIRDLPAGQFLLMAVMTGFMDSKKNVQVKDEQDFQVRITMYSESEI